MQSTGRTQSCGCGDQTYYFLGNHAAHTDADDMQLPLISPAKMINNLKYIFGHL